MKISVLVSARKNSKYLAKFLAGFFEHHQTGSIELLVINPFDDTWNKEIEAQYARDYHVRFFKEDHGLGRAGLHRYFNDLYTHAKGEWIIYFCDDHFTNVTGWDFKLLRVIDDKKLDFREPWVIVPKFDNAGSMNHVLSRGFIEAMGGKLSQHGNLDSYINDVLARVPADRTIKVDDPWFHDFTHDNPSPMSPEHQLGWVSDHAHEMPRYGHMENAIESDAKLVNEALKA